ncbi:unnamed protein product [Didymodactylos carnosus]|uniref:Uncharacterized protein n=1 Tax=Didymodactylos carnosus TaxID=1234261 RepID=A0A813VP46_9BILA|nr:unnamed protein product [Didymodactylos carnosus]CAF1081726.1 unnamed protein product [Didymodactylos carnosus]CAF3627688.1 unnamed protein product [Didymodactylos carnosus]CAF3844609.1 unnamed protein product [Didymodactylos carnosus]
MSDFHKHHIRQNKDTQHFHSLLQSDKLPINKKQKALAMTDVNTDTVHVSDSKADDSGTINKPVELLPTIDVQSQLSTFEISNNEQLLMAVFQQQEELIKQLQHQVMTG